MIFKLELGRGTDWWGIDVSPCHREVQDLKDRPVILNTGTMVSERKTGYVYLTVRRYTMRLRLPGVKLPKIDAPRIMGTMVGWGKGQ